MHIPSTRVYNEMNFEEASLWYVPANGGEALALLIKLPTSSIKALIVECPLKLYFGKKDYYLCNGVRILDIPDAPLFISGVQRESEEHSALIRAFKEREFPVFVYNEMDVCLAWTNIKIKEEDAFGVLDFLGQKTELYVGTFTKEASNALDCFCFSVDSTMMYPEAHIVPTLEITPVLESWRINDIYFFGVNDYHNIIINEKNEGEMFERAIWASLVSVFPLTLYKSPQVKIGSKMRELTDVFSYYTYGSFFIEAKDLSVLNAGYNRNQKRRTLGVQKQVKKAISQLVGASKAYLRGESIFGSSGTELKVNREKPPHCIVLITELMNWGDWSEIETQLFQAMKITGAFFHLLDLREFIAILKGSSGKAELFDYNLMQRCKLCVEESSIFIRSQ